nr:PAX-interacting protein 1-like [Aedes albopictus]
MARLRERQELQKRRTEVELEKKFFEEQRELLEASIAAEVERRSQVSRMDSRRRVQDWIESSADQTTSAAEGNRQPAASVVQQHDTHPRQGNSDAAAAADNLDIQLHSSPFRDRTIPAFEATGDFSDLQPLPEVISQHNAKDLIRELRVRLERCLLQSEPTSPQLADLQQQLQLCREEIEGMHSTVYRLTTVSMPAAQTDNIGTTVSSNDELVQPVAKPLGAIPKHRPNEFLQVPHLRQYAFGYQPPVQQELVLPPPVQQPTVQQSAMQQPPVQQHAESQHPVQQPPVQEPLLQSRTGQQSAMQEPPVQQYIEQQPPVQQPPLVQQFSVQQSMMQQPLVQQIVDRQNPVHQHSVQQPSMQRHVEHQHPAQQPPVQQLSVQKPSVQQPSVQQPSVQRPSVQQPSAQEYFVHPRMQQCQVRHSQVQQPSVQQSSTQHPSEQQHVERHHPVPRPSVPHGQIQRPMQLSSAQ